MESPRIRPATTDDVAQLVEVASESSFAAHWSEPQYRALFSPGAPRRLILVASQGLSGESAIARGRIAGFVVARAEGVDWEIENLAVRESWQRRGIATGLLNRIRQFGESENAIKLFLEVRSSATAARALYEKLGFEICGYRRHYYLAPAEDAVLYSLCL